MFAYKGFIIGFMKKIILISIFIAFVFQYAVSAEYSYSPSQLSAIKSKLNGNVNAGDIVYLEDGTYNDFQIVFKGTGTQSNPIILKAKNPGKAILTGKLNIRIGGSHLIVDGLVLKDGMAANGTDIVEFRSSTSAFAYNCRLTNTVIDNCNNPDESYRNSADKSERWVVLYGNNNRVDHSYFTNKINGGVLMMVVIKEANSQNNNHIIDYNFFGNRPHFEPGNNAEIIRLGDSNTSQLSCKSLIENNFFYTCNGEVEIISIKSCDNILRKNVFYESQGSVVCRHGHRNIIESNAFIGNNVGNCGGVRIINEGHKVYNNFFQDIQGTGSRSALCVMMGIFEKPTSSTDLEREPLNAYHQVKDVEISHNTFVNCKNIDLGTNTRYTYAAVNPYYPNQTINGTLRPECLLAQNVFYNTTVNSVINQLNDEKITYSGNIYRFKKNSSIAGFTYRALNYVKAAAGYGKGIYKLDSNDADILNLASGFIDFPYILSDISGNVRTGIKSVGAQQYSDRNMPFDVVKPSECGVDWYQSQQVDTDKIKAKTDFWQDSPPSGLSETDWLGEIQISREGNSYKITSDIVLSGVRVLDMKGKTVLSKNQISQKSFLLDFTAFPSAIYIIEVNTERGMITAKVLN